jgi:hypothetical protein
MCLIFWTFLFMSSLYSLWATNSEAGLMTFDGTIFCSGSMCNLGNA